MSMPRLTLSVVLAIGVSGCVAPARDKLLGTWEMTSGDGTGAIFVFGKDGKLSMTFPRPKGQKWLVEGTWEVHGDTITTVNKMGKGTAKILSLTDTELITVDDKDRRYEFRRI